MRFGSIAKLIGIGAFALVMAGCGGGGTSGGGDTPVAPKESPIVTTSDDPRHINIPYGENIILGGGSLRYFIYDSQGNKVDSGGLSSVPLEAGDYTIIFKEITAIYSDSQGVIFYLNSNIYVEDLPLNSTVTIAKRAAEIYKLNVQNETTFLLSNSRSITFVYDSSLNEIDYYFNETLTLTPGTYYFVVNTNTRVLKGDFSVTPF